jgi:alpha-galactosidase
MVIDDGWQKNRCNAPWTETNERFPDMKKLAAEMRAAGVRPGIWVRYLINGRDDEPRKVDYFPEEWYLEHSKKVLDPSHPEVLNYVKETTERLVGWGYRLIKHDFSTFDIFGRWGFQITDKLAMDNWHFYDKTKTNAEIVLDFYRLILDAAGDMLIIGCNTVSHLSAGLVHISRTGDDTSGREWERTKIYGVNTLAFRLCQNEIFYMCDADCVGIVKGKIPWEKNRQWLHLLSYSNTPLFISCNDEIDSEQRKDISEAYKVFNKPHSFRPVDVYTTKTPSQWEIDGESLEYNWG